MIPKQSKYRPADFAWCLILLLLVLAGCGAQDEATPVATTVATPLGSKLAVAQPIVHGLMPDRLQLPSIKVDTKVVELSWSASQSDNGRILSEWDVADNAAGWHKNSVLLGERGNLVMSGHNNIKGAVFRALDQLKRGDQAVVWSGKQRFVYRVADVVIVPEKYASPQQRQDNVKWIGPFADERLTLVSCWPRDDNTHRIIIVAYPEKK